MNEVQSIIQVLNDNLYIVAGAIFLTVILWDLLAALLSAFGVPRLGLPKIIGIGILLLLAAPLADVITSRMVAG